MNQESVCTLTMRLSLLTMRQYNQHHIQAELPSAVAFQATHT
jgi:hypothetical protein